MAYARRLTAKDATWQRAWTADALSDLVSISAIVGPAGPRHGDIAFVTATGFYYLWTDDGNWSQINGIMFLAGNQTVTGRKTFTADRGIVLERGSPILELTDTSQPADQRVIGIANGFNVAQTLEFYSDDDSHTAQLLLFSVTRATGNMVVQGTIQTVGGSIIFPSTQIPSANVNALDDYEEGTWTPADGSGAGLSLTVAANSARYTKIGRQVTVTADITYPATASGAAAIINGLPFTIGAAPGGGIVSFGNVGQAITFYLRAATTNCEIYTVSGSAITNANMTGKTVAFVGQYFV